MPEPATINDLLNKDKLDNPEEEALAARNLRQSRRGGTPEQDSSLDNLLSLAGGIGGMGTDNRRKPDGSGRDNLGRPIRQGRPLPASRQSQGGGGGLGSGQTGQGGEEAEPAFAGGQPMGAGGDLDSRLMAARLREEKNKALRQAQGGEEKEGEKGEGGERGGKGEEAKKDKEGEEGEEGGGLGDRISQLKEKANLKKRAQEKIKEKVTAPAKQGTNRLLKNAWIHLIDSFGATLLYIDLHVFLQKVLGDKLFCKLGEEWIPKKIQAAGGETGKATGKKIGLVETMGCCLLNLLALIIVLAILTIILLIAKIIENPLSFIGQMLGFAWNAVTGLFISK